MQTCKSKKLTAASLDEFPLIIAATPATKQERRVALGVVLLLALVFVVIAPFASVKLPRVERVCAGTALAPLFVAIFLGAGVWWLMPLIVAAALTALLLLSTKVPLEASVGDVGNAASAERLQGDSGSLPQPFSCMELLRR